MNSRNNQSKLKKFYALFKKEGLISAIRLTIQYIKLLFYSIRSDGRRGLPKYIINKLVYRGSLPSPYKLIYINPKTICYMTAPAFLMDLSKYYTYVIAGDWDKKKVNLEYNEREKLPERSLIPFDNYLLYRSFKAHFNNNVPWVDTEFYQWKINEIFQGRTKSHEQYGTKEKMDARLQMVDNLFFKIMKNGYKTKKELFEFENGCLTQYDININPLNRTEVCINIGSTGEIIFDDGRHRFAIAKILKLDSIPVRVIVRHSNWLALRREIEKANSITELSEKALCVLDHPDMADITTKWIKK